MSRLEKQPTLGDPSQHAKLTATHQRLTPSMSTKEPGNATSVLLQSGPSFSFSL
jgi:hypothetical protein